MNYANRTQRVEKMFKISFESESLKFIESLNVDTQLQLSDDDLVSKLRQNTVPAIALTSAERLKKIKEFPSAPLLSKLAWKVYEEGETHELPEGWKELTTASNKDIVNFLFSPSTGSFINRWFYRRTATMERLSGIPKTITWLWHIAVRS